MYLIRIQFFCNFRNVIICEFNRREQIRFLSVTSEYKFTSYCLTIFVRNILVFNSIFNLTIYPGRVFVIIRQSLMRNKIRWIILIFLLKTWSISFVSRFLNEEAAIQRCSGYLQACNFLKEKLWHRCFPVNFAKLLRTPFSWNISGGCFFKCSIPRAVFALPQFRTSRWQWWRIVNFEIEICIYYMMVTIKMLRGVDPWIFQKAHLRNKYQINAGESFKSKDESFNIRVGS